MATLRYAACLGFVATVFTMILFWATDPAQAQTLRQIDLDRFQQAECISCLTDPANDRAATRGDVYDVRRNTETNAEHIAVMNRAHNETIDAVNEHARQLDPIQQRIADQQQANREALQERQALQDMVDYEVEEGDRRIADLNSRLEDVAALAGVEDSTALDTVRSNISSNANRIDALEKDVDDLRKDAAGWAAMAMAADVPHIESGRNAAISIRAATIDTAGQAVALSGAQRISRDWSINGSLATDTRSVGAVIGAAWQF